jgi:PhzF family phenazine biosynthesis protein
MTGTVLLCKKFTILYLYTCPVLSDFCIIKLIAMHSFFQVAAFAGDPFSGNMAAVIILHSSKSRENMQKIATQNNLPATAFVRAADDGFSIRWFTPNNELTLCGHATLASAHILFELGLATKGSKIHFTAGKNDLWACWNNGLITMDFPIFHYQPDSIPIVLKSFFSSAVLSTFRTQDRYLIELIDEDSVRNLIPDFTLLRPYKCIVTARCASGSRYDFVSRYFNGPDGVPEDAVTGSSHCSLAPFWSERMKKNKLTAYQASPRGGELILELQNQQVLISGQAVTVVDGRWMI